MLRTRPLLRQFCRSPKDWGRSITPNRAGSATKIPPSGGLSQVTELRVGADGPDGHFQNPEIPIARGTGEIIKGRSLVNDRAICPNGAFPTTEIQERVPESETVRTLRTSLNLLGDGFVEAIADQTLFDLARDQCKKSKRKICGQVLRVPIVEAAGKTGVGKFGWKDQHASLLSFAGDAYLNEMGITNKLFPTEVTLLCNTVREPNDVPGRGWSRAYRSVHSLHSRDRSPRA